MTTDSRGGDPLAAMYVLAAAAMGLGSLLVIALLFVPRDWRSGSGGSETYVPGTVPAFEPLSHPVLRIETPGVTEIERGRYLAVINAYNWSFQPAEIRVPAGAEVTFRGRSINDYHGIAIAGTNVVLSLTQNEPAEATYTFETAGEYLFVCSEYCGAGHAAMMGKVIVY